jgi:AcrR family transcriptional regulator
MAPKTKTWQRARRPEQKQQRRAAILEAAATLLDREGLDGTGLNAIARAAGLSKANIYRYFESREAVLLDLLLAESERWTKAFERRLKRLAATNDIEQVARAFAATISRQPRYCVLITVLANVLEQNVSEKLVVEFKRRINELMEPLLDALTSAVPGLSPENARRFLLMQMLATSGIWPHCHPAPIVQRVLKRPEFAAMRLDFQTTVRDHAAALLRGLLAQAK